MFSNVSDVAFKVLFVKNDRTSDCLPNLRSCREAAAILSFVSYFKQIVSQDTPRIHYSHELSYTSQRFAVKIT